MFSYETDLTLDSVMVGKTISKRDNERLDNSFYTTYLRDKNTDLIFKGFTPDVDHENLHLLYALFGDRCEVAKVYYDFQMYASGHVLNCECCGIELNIFNKTPYTICKTCDNSPAAPYYEDNSKVLLNV